MEQFVTIAIGILAVGYFLLRLRQFFLIATGKSGAGCGGCGCGEKRVEDKDLLS